MERWNIFVSGPKAMELNDSERDKTVHLFSLNAQLLQYEHS